MLRLLRALPIASLPILVIATSPEAATYYVRTSGGTTSQCTGTTNANYPGSGSSQPCAYSNLQDAIDATRFGDTIKLRAGQTFDTYYGFNLTHKGTPPTGTDADYITITTDDPSGTPSPLSGYPANHARITTAMAANMPVVRTTSSNPVFWFNNSSKYWKIERLNITNQDTGAQPPRLMSNGETTPSAMAHYPDRIVLQYNWIHPIEETGTVLTTDNMTRTVGNALYLEATNVLIQYNSFQGFAGWTKYGGDAGSRLTSSNLLVGSYGETYTIRNNLLEAWTYAFFSGGSSMGPWLVTKGGTVSNCAASPYRCDFSNTTGLSVGDPVAIYVSGASPPVWGSTFVSGITGSTVTFTAPLCTSYDGNNTCSAIGTLPSNGAAARWDGHQPSNIRFTRNIFAHYPEWQTLLNGCGGKGYFEVKACKNCAFDGNTFLGCSSSTVTVRNQNGDFPWASLDNLTFSNNYWRTSTSPFTAFLEDSTPTRKSSNVTWTNNLIVGLYSTADDGIDGGILSMNFQGGHNTTITHNTVLFSKTSPTAYDAPSYSTYRAFNSFMPNTVTGLMIRDNFLGAAENYCWDAQQTQTIAITNCWPSATITHNVLLNPDGYSESAMNASWLTPYPNNAMTTSVTTIGFLSAPGRLDDTGNYRLAPSSPYKSAASDGTDIGVNYTTLIDRLGYDLNSGASVTGPPPPSGLQVR